MDLACAARPERRKSLTARMADYAVVSTERAPIVSVRVIDGPTDENYRRHLEELAAAFRAQDRFGMVFDTGDLAKFPARYREMLNRWIEETQPEFEGRWICAAFVIRNRLIRGVLTAVYWLNAPYYDHKVVGSPEEAWRWVTEQLQNAGVLVDGSDRESA